jgi:hypothetical protein
MNDDTQVQDTELLEDGDDQAKLQSGSDLANQALQAARAGQTPPATKSKPAASSDDELAASNELAETLVALQRVVESNAEQLESLGRQLKEKRELLNNIFENDTLLGEAQQQLETFSSQVKERKSKLQSDAQVTALKVQIGEIKEQKTEIEESLSNHLVNYYSLTNSTSFDTSDGDQWDFTVRAKVKARGKQKAE